MKVTVINRYFAEPDPGYYGVRMASVEIADACPHCGGPRGEPHVVPQPEDGDVLYPHQWQNPCGHLDTYRHVLVEAGVLDPTRLREPVPEYVLKTRETQR